MIVVSNTSPLNYLILIELVHVLPTLYRRVYAPRRVMIELAAAGSPELVRQWATQPPDWLTIGDPAHVDPKIALHPGEAHAIALALELRADLILIDERRGTRVARAAGLKPIGLLGVLDAASGAGLIHVQHTLDRLAATNFRMTPELRERLIARDARRRPRRNGH